jgi:hypothetical protein
MTAGFYFAGAGNIGRKEPGEAPDSPASEKRDQEE